MPSTMNGSDAVVSLLLRVTFPQVGFGQAESDLLHLVFPRLLRELG